MQTANSEDKERAERRQIDIQIEAKRKINNVERLEILEREQLKEQLTRRINNDNDRKTRALAKP